MFPQISNECVSEMIIVKNPRDMTLFFCSTLTLLLVQNPRSTRVCVSGLEKALRLRNTDLWHGVSAECLSLWAREKIWDTQSYFSQKSKKCINWMRVIPRQQTGEER